MQAVPPLDPPEDFGAEDSAPDNYMRLWLPIEFDGELELHQVADWVHNLLPLLALRFHHDKGTASVELPMESAMALADAIYRAYGQRPPMLTSGARGEAPHQSQHYTDGEQVPA